MRMGQGVRTGLGHGGISCVLQTQFSSFFTSSMMSEVKEPFQNGVLLKGSKFFIFENRSSFKSVSFP